MNLLEDSRVGFGLGFLLATTVAVAKSPRRRDGTIYISLTTLPSISLLGGVFGGMITEYLPGSLKAPTNFLLGAFSMLNGYMIYTSLQPAAIIADLPDR